MKGDLEPGPPCRAIGKKMLVLEEENRDLYDRITEANLKRQYDLLMNCIEIGLGQGGRVFDKHMLWDLNHVAVANICQFGGRFREEPIYVDTHKPPHYREVPHLVDQFIATVHENWYLWSYTELAAYGLWRLNWIHPLQRATEEPQEQRVIIFCASKKAAS